MDDLISYQHMHWSMYANVFKENYSLTSAKWRSLRPLAVQLTHCSSWSLQVVAIVTHIVGLQHNTKLYTTSYTDAQADSYASRGNSISVAATVTNSIVTTALLHTACPYEFYMQWWWKLRSYNIGKMSKCVQVMIQLAKQQVELLP